MRSRPAIKSMKSMQSVKSFKSTKSVAAAVAALAAALLLQACGTGGAVDASGRDRLNLAVLANFDTPDPLAAGVVRGVEMAISEYNARSDSTFQVHLVKVSSGGKDGPAEAAKRVVAIDRLIGVLGPLRTEDALAAQPVFEAAAVPFLTPSVSSNQVPQRDWRSFRRLVASDRREVAVLMDITTRKVKGAIDIFDDGSKTGVFFAAGAHEELDAKHRPVPRSESLPAKGDLKPLAASVVQSPPDAIFYSGGAGRGMQFWVALKRAGYKGAFVASHQIREAKVDNAETSGIISDSPAADTSDAGLADFVAAFRQRFGAPAAPLSAESHEGALMLLEAIQEVEPKPATIADFFRLNRGFLGDTKSYEYDDLGDLPTAPIWTYELKGTAWKLTGRSDHFIGQGKTGS